MKTALHPTERFTSRVESYIKHRPGYPEELLSFLVQEKYLNEQSILADIGSGTGKLTQLFLAHGNLVYGVEPNRAMRQAAETLLAGSANFISIDGSAEHTHLVSHSIDLIVAGQAFHWFDREASRKEFRRILRNGESVLTLIWNKRDSSRFLDDYEDFLRQYAVDYQAVQHQNITSADLQKFYGEAYTLHTFENHQYLDFDGLQGRYDSCSYALPPEHAAYQEAMQALEILFDRHAIDQQVDMAYATKMYLGKIS